MFRRRMSPLNSPPSSSRPSWPHGGAIALVALAAGLPFVFGVTQAPQTSFWPLMASAACAWGIAALAWAGRLPGTRLGWGLAWGLLLGAVAGACIGLLQYFVGDPGWAPWVHPAAPGQALGNLRQRNQQATLMLLGLWALLWLVARLQAVAGERPASRWPLALAVAVPWAVVLLAACAAATASRTGALEWLVLLGLLLLWRRGQGALAPAVAAVGLAAYLLAAWWLPELLAQWTGVRADGLFSRLADESSRCTSRRVLWANVLHLVGERPWTGWGWGELDYAHYITAFPGERFCVLLDNAHDLPLHLAVELGLPVALLLCGGALWAVWRARPWHETQPLRRLAWGVLALVGVHSLLEFPLWYGPFQLAVLLAVAVLLPPKVWQALRWPVGAALLAAPVLAWMLARDYAQVSALYRPVAERPAALRGLTAQEAARRVTFFRAPAEFAWLTTTPATAANAQAMHATALRLLHYSPEPRVVVKLIASARLLGREGEAALHEDRYRRAYPRDYARWRSGAPATGAPQRD
jgi:O-antigen ligase